jgi:hypothetical protein
MDETQRVLSTGIQTQKMSETLFSAMPSVIVLVTFPVPPI